MLNTLKNAPHIRLLFTKLPIVVLHSGSALPPAMYRRYEHLN